MNCYGVRAGFRIMLDFALFCVLCVFHTVFWTGGTFFERWIGCSLPEHCLQQKTLWQLTEHVVTEEGDAPIHYPSFCVWVSRTTHARLSVNTCTHTRRRVNTSRNIGSFTWTHSQSPSLSHTHAHTHTYTRTWQRASYNDALTHSMLSRISSLCCCD